MTKYIYTFKLFLLYNTDFASRLLVSGLPYPDLLYLFRIPADQSRPVFVGLIVP